jgi:hypothetical protein
MAEQQDFSKAARRAAAAAQEKSRLAAAIERRRHIEDVRNSVLAWIEEKWKNPRCPMCDINQWVVGELAEIRQHTFGASYGVDPIMPAVPVVCGNCGFTAFVNAVIAGAVSIPEAELSNEPQSDPEEAGS